MVDFDKLSNEIKEVMDKYGLSLAQFGSMVGAPATSVKRWREGVQPQKRYLYQITLVLGLIRDPYDVFFDLKRAGQVPNNNTIEKYWDVFASLIKGIQESYTAAIEYGLPKPEVGSALVSGVQGLLSLIASEYTSRDQFKIKAFQILASKIGSLLK